MDMLKPLDAMFVDAEDEDENTSMAIASIAVFEGPVLTHKEVMALIADRLPLMPRYRQKLRTVPFRLGRPVWVDDPDFDLGYHIRRTALPEPGEYRQLADLMARVMSRRLDRDHPLWEYWVVEGLARDRWALISKVHHCMIDGIGGADLYRVIMELPSDQMPPRDQPAAQPPSGISLAAQAAADIMLLPLRQARALGAAAAGHDAGGLGHTAVIFSSNDDIIRRFSEAVNAGRIIVNSPGSIGALGGVYNDMVPTFSFGCGTGGGNSTTDNVNVYHYLNIKRVARRTPAHMWFRIPSQIYFNMNAAENLGQFASRSTIIITNPALEQMGHVDIVRRYLPAQTPVHVSAIPDAEPEAKVVMEGVEILKLYHADQIIALGGGSVIDAAKIMKLKYESPQADLEELAAPFLDIRKRVVQYPTEKTNRARLIAIPTTSGTGSEVTPFAVLFDKQSGRKVTLADYSLTPDVAIVDPQFVMSMPKGLTADTGIDCLTHGLEAAVSIYASPYTDSHAMQAIQLAFKYLPIAYEHPRDEEARSMMHNAACIAAMAFANVSVGVNHALAHAFGARFRVAHGRANALMLPHVIAYNASVPTKFMPSPNQRAYTAHKKYALIADLLGLGGSTVEEKVRNLVTAIEQLLDQLAFPRSIAELGISREEFERAVPDLVRIAFDDPSWRTNPRMPLLKELEGLLWSAYEGRPATQHASRERTA